MSFASSVVLRGETTSRIVRAVFKRLVVEKSRR